jgi:hypothetical protein
MKTIKLPEKAKAALEADGKTKVRELPKPLSRETQQIVHRWVRERIFGPAMRPLFRWWLSTCSSHTAIKASWMIREQHERTRN